MLYTKHNRIDSFIYQRGHMPLINTDQFYTAAITKYGHAAQWPRIRFDANTPKARTIRRVKLINSRDEHMEDADHHSATGRSSSNIMVDSHLCSRDVLPLSA